MDQEPISSDDAAPHANLPTPESVSFRIALAFELALAIVALGIAWALGHDPLPGIRLRDFAWQRHAVAALWGLAAAAPMIGLLVAAEHFPFGPIRRLQRFVERRVSPLFARYSLPQMAIVALGAGIGEEVLFRGLIQEGIKAKIGGESGFWIALAAASLLFGLCHFLTPAYFVAAALIGVYLGLLLEWTGDLTAPIVTHAVYDFFALWWMTRQAPAR